VTVLAGQSRAIALDDDVWLWMAWRSHCVRREPAPEALTLGCIADRLTVLAVIIPALQSLSSPVWITLTLVSLGAWALIALELRPRRVQNAVHEELVVTSESTKGYEVKSHEQHLDVA
jgi:hypothetical protein